MNEFTSLQKLAQRAKELQEPELPNAMANMERHAAARGDGIRAFFKHFAATTRAEDVRPATQAFLKAAAFLLRK